MKSESAVKQLSMCGKCEGEISATTCCCFQDRLDIWATRLTRGYKQRWRRLQETPVSDFLPGTWSCTAPPDVWPRTCCSPWWRRTLSLLSLLLLLLLSLRRQNALCVDNPPLTSKHDVLRCVFTGCCLDRSPVFQPFDLLTHDGVHRDDWVQSNDTLSRTKWPKV